MNSQVHRAYSWVMVSPEIYGPMSVQVYWYPNTSEDSGSTPHPTYRYILSPNPDSISRYTRKMSQPTANWLKPPCAG